MKCFTNHSFLNFIVCIAWKEILKRVYKKGYSALVIVSYVYIPGESLALDEAYYTGGSKEAFEEIKSHVKRLAFEITQYNSMNDFVIA